MTKLQFAKKYYEENVKAEGAPGFNELSQSQVNKLMDSFGFAWQYSAWQLQEAKANFRESFAQKFCI